MGWKDPERRRAYKRAQYYKHREKILAQQKARYALKGEEIRAVRRKSDRKYDLKKYYGMTVEEWDIMFDEQGKCCAVCKSPEPLGHGHWHTDHDHNTGVVRGILCGPCNTTIGFAKENVDRLRSLADYLEYNHGRS